LKKEIPPQTVLVLLEPPMDMPLKKPLVKLVMLDVKNVLLQLPTVPFVFPEENKNLIVFAQMDNTKPLPQNVVIVTGLVLLVPEKPPLVTLVEETDS